MKNLTGLNIGLHFMRNNSVVTDTTHGLKRFPHLTMQVKTASSKTTAKLQTVLTYDALTIPPRTTKTITAFVDHSSERNTTGTVTPLDKFTERASLLISHSMSTIIDKQSSSQSNQYHGISISKQKEYTDCRVLRSHSGANQVHLTSRYGNPQYDSARWSSADCLPERTSQNEKTRAAKEHFLVPDSWQSWKTRGSHPNRHEFSRNYVN